MRSHWKIATPNARKKGAGHWRWSPTKLAALCLLSAIALVSAPASATWPPARAPKEQLDASVREAVHNVTVAEAGANIVVTSYRPPGPGPFPWILLSHGSATTAEVNRKIGRNRNVALAREWVSRGYAVVAPVRRGYGASGGDQFGDAKGSCKNPDYRKAGEGAAVDLLATLTWARTQRDLDPKRWLLVGQSAGGFASIYTASKRPDGLVAVLAFAPGRGGDPEKHPGEPCASDRMAKLLASITPQINVPVLWFYAVNDEYMNPRVQKLWFESFRAAGGRGELFVTPPFPARHGHGVFPSKSGFPLWTPVVAGFFRTQKLDLPFPINAPTTPAAAKCATCERWARRALAACRTQDDSAATAMERSIFRRFLVT